jgi:hypothetical protein
MHARPRKATGVVLARRHERERERESERERERARERESERERERTGHGRDRAFQWWSIPSCRVSTSRHDGKNVILQFA